MTTSPLLTHSSFRHVFIALSILFALILSSHRVLSAPEAPMRESLVQLELPDELPALPKENVFKEALASSKKPKVRPDEDLSPHIELVRDGGADHILGPVGGLGHSTKPSKSRILKDAAKIKAQYRREGKKGLEPRLDLGELDRKHWWQLWRKACHNWNIQSMALWIVFIRPKGYRRNTKILYPWL
ncbi:hypothetical protein BJ684DRAFT_22158 [Piptocephalis cylindrospora]|uniref:Uncharacterized protein n=1 Tax=Piptocephalis cylindrospora TaxID=1907219 RepID=A0A4V1IXJ6_9FUNG|nr:hypothetical protein BJ684DRAFT_22158 [Piptocephalis cylindrospora]|eukprot:RKP11289.1 hypothetical protein BJ684DRAFT_22158 [Piptocephalis cylindrospora]